MNPADYLIPISAVIVAIFTLSGVIFVAIHRKDATTPELWTENGNLRDRLDRMDRTIEEQDDKIETLKADSRTYRNVSEAKVAVLGTAFDILFRMTGGDMQALTPEDCAAVARARALRTDSGIIAIQVVN